MFMKAIDPNQAKAAAGAPPAQPAAPAQPVAQAAAVPVQPAAPAGSALPPVDLSGVPDAYPGDDASKADLAKWLAKEAQKAGLPPELPVMASLVESGVANLNHGDADSVGFFQMRVGLHNNGKYAGFPTDPQKQIQWFIDNAEAVKKARIASGNTTFETDPNQWGEWIADTEKPAEQYRGRYQERLAEAQSLIRS